MARLSKGQWALLRADFEVKGMSLSALSNKHGADKGNISRRSKKEAWEKGKIQPIIAKKMRAIKDLAECDEEITTLSTTGVVEINREVEERLRREGLFNDSLEYNQAVANKLLKSGVADGSIEFQHVNMHSQVTNRNKEGLLGKAPQTQVNIQNNSNFDADSVIEALLRKHG